MKKIAEVVRICMLKTHRVVMKLGARLTEKFLLKDRRRVGAIARNLKEKANAKKL
jgi:hypothetical protein